MEEIMKSLFFAVYFLVLGTLTATAQGNFQLLVSFEDGVKLEVYGFDEDRNQIFSEKAPKETSFDGNNYWMALINEDLVFSGQLRFLCVRDVRGEWTIPATVGQEPKDLVCDYKPRDVGRGTYMFVPNRR
jgi:hypothetical protein